MSAEPPGGDFQEVPPTLTIFNEVPILGNDVSQIDGEQYQPLVVGPVVPPGWDFSDVPSNPFQCGEMVPPYAFCEQEIVWPGTGVEMKTEPPTGYRADYAPPLQPDRYRSGIVDRSILLIW